MNIEFKKIRTKKDLVDYIHYISSMVNMGVTDVNNLNDSMISIVDKSLTYGQSLTEGLKVLANQVQDIMILDGYLASKVNPFEDINFTTSNTIVDKETLSVRLSNKKIEKAFIKNIIASINSKEESFDKASFMAGKTRLKLQTKDILLNTSLEILLSEEKVISELSINIEDNGTKLPKIKSISIVSADGNISQPIIYNSSAKSYSITANTETIRFKPAIGNKIIIEMLKDDSYLANTNNIYEILINEVLVYAADAYDTGEVIFGPIKSDSPILKAGVFFKTDAVVDVAISTDKINWNTLSNINSISDIDSILNINNIDANSITTSEVVKSIFVKLIISALKIIPDNITDKYIVRTIVSDNGYAEVSYDEGYKVSGIYENANVSYGRSAISKFIPSEYKKPFGILDGKKLSLVENEETYIFSETDMKIYTDMDKVYITGTSGSTTDLYAGNAISVFTQSIPQLQSIPKNTNLNCCIKMKVPCGIYTAKYGHLEWQIDLLNGFSRSVDSFNYLADATSVVDVYDQWGASIASVSAALVNDRYVVSLYDVFFEEINNNAFNKYYPYGDVNTKYSISSGKIVCRKQDIVDIQAFIQYESAIKKRLLKNSIKKNIILDRPYVAKYSESLDSYVFKYAAKLKYSKILKGSVTIDSSRAAIQSINSEVDYIDGKTEFTRYATTTYIVPTTPTNVIVLTGIKPDGQIYFSGETDLFINRVYSVDELLFRGDYFIDASGIRLPAGIETSRFISTEILYESKLTNNPTGLYSVDYENGIIYTQNKIYENIVITYMHSTLYATYVGVKEIAQAEYTDTGSSVIIYGSGNSYFVETTPKDSVIVEVSTSPILKDIEIRFTT